MTDTKEIREAKEAVTEAKENIQIAGMEKEISGLNDVIDDLDRKIEESNKYYDSLMEQTEKYWDSLIKGLEDYKTRWQELADIEEQAKMETALRNLGITTDNILSMSESAFQSFKGSYLGLLNEMYSGNDEMINMLRELGGIPADALNPLSGAFSDAADSLDRFAGQTGSAAAAVQSVSGALNEVAGADISTPIEQFNALGSSVDNTAASISGGTAQKAGASSAPAVKNTTKAQNSSDSLISSIADVGEAAAETLGEPDGEGMIGKFGELGGTIAEAGSHVEGIIDRLNELDGMDAECTITVNIETKGDMPAYAEGTAISDTIGSMDLNSSRHKAEYRGSAHAEGTALVSGDWAVQSNEGNSLVGEEGYEIIVRNGKFFTVGDNGAEMFPIKKGDIVFNHEQSEQLLKNGHISGRGKAYADGTVGGGKILTKEGAILEPYNPDTDTSYFAKLYKAWTKHYGNIDDNVEEIRKTLAHHITMEHNQKMHNEVNNFISRSNSVVNNRNIQPNITFGDIHVTCPGVTDKQVAEKLPGVLDEALDNKFRGFSNLADQYSRIRR